MNSIYGYILFFVVLYLLVFLVDYFLINKRKFKQINKKKAKKNKKDKEISELNYLIYRFKLDKEKINYSKCLLDISLINAFIISFVATVISAIPAKIVWQLLIGFVLIFGLIYALYEIYGRILVKKGWGENE